VSERYAKLMRDREYRLTWAEKFGLVFELPRTSKVGQAGKLGLLIPFRKVG
jgi:hypothetical protein